MNLAYMLLLWITLSIPLAYALSREPVRASTPEPVLVPIPKPQRPALAYCGFCREHFVTKENPPYGVIHCVEDEYEHIDGEYVAHQVVKHRHAITRAEMIGYAP